MKQKTLSAEVWRELWRDSTVILSRDGNRLRLILATLIVATAALPYLLLLQLAGLLLSLEGLPAAGAALISSCFSALLFLLTLFLTLPLASGLFYLAGRMEADEETVLADVFHAFTNGAVYRSVLRLGVCLALPFAALYVVPRGIVAALAGFAGKQILRWIPVALAAVGADCLLIFLLLGGFRWIFTIFRHENRQTRTESARRVGAWYWGHFLPYLILSVLSVLIYLLADILPRMLISYFRLWRMLTGGATIDDASIGG